MWFYLQPFALMMGSSKSEDQKLWPSDGADHRLLSVALTLFDLTALSLWLVPVSTTQCTAAPNSPGCCFKAADGLLQR